jgi:hypothetical protein
MGNGQKLGCFGFIALLFLIAVVWQAILYVGIPIALAGGLAAAYLFKIAKDDEANDHSRRNAALLIAGGSTVLFLVSLAGNIFSDDGPFGRPERREAASPEGDEFIATPRPDFDTERRLSELKAKLPHALEECDYYASPDRVAKEGMGDYNLCLENYGISQDDLEWAKAHFGS